MTPDITRCQASGARVEQQIFDIIKKDVCGTCQTSWDGDCSKHVERCEAGFRRQAKAIYEQVVRVREGERQWNS